MKRFSIAFALALAVGLLAVPATLAANGPKPQLNYGQELNASQCGPGTLVINVTQKIINDYDSAVHGNAWANDTVSRRIQVWQTGDGTFCAIVSYTGQFVTMAGDSPNGTGEVSDGITGTLEGGYQRTFSGTLLSDPIQPTNGTIGTFDYQCVDAYDCPGAVDWTSFYFSGVSNDNLPWWGWIYRTSQNGTWVNSQDGNSGDITG